MANVNNYIEYINEKAKNSPTELIASAEERYRRIVRNAADQAYEGDYHIIMLAGPSSAGKTTTARLLAEGLKSHGLSSHTISLDDFYLDKGTGPRREDGSLDLETVHSLDVPLIRQRLEELESLGRAEIPVFDFTTGRRSDRTTTVELNEHSFVIIEGLHALNPIITDALLSSDSIKVYLNVSSRIYNSDMDIILNKRNLRFIRRMIRDYKFRACSSESTFDIWDSVTDGELRYLAPYKQYADILINTIHIYEPCVLKNQAIPLLQAVQKQSPHFSAAKKLLKALDSFESLPEAMVPESSLLREFLG